MTVGIVRTEWAGLTGGPGLTQMAIAANPAGQFLAAEIQTAVNAVRAFWAALVTLLPDEASLTVNATVDQFNEVDGTLEYSGTAATPPAVVIGTSAASYQAGAGMKVSWETGTIQNGRRVRGATYIVPASGGVFTSDGVVSSTSRTTVNTACANLISTLTSADLFLQVWSRQLKNPDTGAVERNGFRTQVTSGVCGEKGAFLRGRRD